MKAASKAGSHVDDVGRAAVHAGSHVDDVGRSAVHAGGHVDDAALVRHGDDPGAVVLDGASHGDEGARAAEKDGLAKDLLKDGAGKAIEAAAESDSASAEGRATSERSTEAEDRKHAARMGTLRELAVVALDTNDHPLAEQIARIREKELGRHQAAVARVKR